MAKLRRPHHQGHRRRGRHRHPRPDRQPLPLDAGVETWHQQARFEGVGTRTRSAAILAAKAASQPPGDWMMVQGGWTPRQFADAPGGFTLEELDRRGAEESAVRAGGLQRRCTANSLALKAVGLDPAGGARRPAAGLASFQPPYALYDAMPKTSPAQLDQNLTDFMHELNRWGSRASTAWASPTTWPRAQPRARCRSGCGRR